MARLEIFTGTHLLSLLRSATLRCIGVLSILAFAFGWVCCAEAQTSQMYGLTTSGALIQIDKTTAQATLIKQLPPQYGTIQGFAYWNGSFVATYDPIIGGNTAGYSMKFVAFGPVPGDEVYLGQTNYLPALPVLTSGPGESLVSQYYSQTGVQLAVASFSNHSFSCGVQVPCVPLPSGETTDGAVFSDVNTVWIRGFVGVGNGKFDGTLTEYTYSNGAWSTALRRTNLANEPAGLALEADLNGNIYTYDAETLNPPAGEFHSWLYKYSVTGGSGAFVGEVVGYPWLVGVVFGPPIGQITSPERNTGLAGAVQLVFDAAQSTVVKTSPVGLSMTVDGVSYSASTVFKWVPGSTHSISVASPQTGGGKSYTFSSWSDGGARTHNVTAALTGGSFTATFR